MLPLARVEGNKWQALLRSMQRYMPVDVPLVRRVHVQFTALLLPARVVLWLPGLVDSDGGSTSVSVGSADDYTKVLRQFFAS